MSNLQLEEALELTPCDVVGEEIKLIQSKLKESKKDFSDDTDNDYIHVRNNLGKLLEQGNTAVEKILKVASESNHPRAFEVVSTMIKTTADVAEQLMDLQEKMKKLKQSDKKNNESDNHQHLHLEMTTEQLNKFLNERN